MPKRFSLLVFFIIICFHAEGQQAESPPYVATAAIQHGFLVAHRPMIVPLQQDHVTSFEAGIIFKPNGKKEWHRTYGFPGAGLALTVWNLGNQQQLGTACSLIPYLDFPLIKGKKSSFDLKCGWGIGYVQKPFDADDNYKNVAIGSHMNCALVVNPRFKTHITDRLLFDCGISLSHFSNGGIATPNLGLNLACLSGGLSYCFGKNQVIMKDPLPPFNRSSRIAFFVAGAMKQVYPADGKNYFAASFSGEKMWQLTRKSAFGFGADLFYDASISQKLEENDLEKKNSLELMKVGIHGGYEMAISDFSLIVNLGGYLYSELNNDGSFYQRIGFRYRFSDHLFGLMQLKAHWGKADFIEWGVGFRIDKTARK